MKIIVGLGNPGLKYRKTRHNAGYMALDALSKKHRIPIKKKGFNGIYGEGRIGGKETILFKPLTYMNLSGGAVEAVCASRLVAKDDLLVISDDVNIPLGSIRMREKGSSGGHNGLKSIIGRRGEDFARLRLGVGAEKVIEDMSAFVLAVFSRREMIGMAKVLEEAVSCAEMWVGKGAKQAMSRGNAEGRLARLSDE